MTVSELLAINSRLNKDDLFSAYKEAVKQLRLNMVVLPCFVETTNSFRIDGFTSMAETMTTESEVAIKEVVRLEDVTLKDSYTGSKSFGTLVIGDPTAEYYGLSEEDFNALNGDHEVTPELYVVGDEITVTNLSDCGTAFFLMYCYVYPYFASSGDPYSVQQFYDFSVQGDWIADTDALNIDPVLLYPVSVLGLGYTFQKYGEIVEATRLKNMSIQYCKMWNKSIKIQYPSDLSTVFQISGYSL